MKRLAMLMILAGCAGFAGVPVPQAARLSGDVLTVTLSDATVCRVTWQASGRLQDCGPGFDYAVTVEPHPNPLHVWTQELAQALDATAAFPPMAEVVITDARGRAYRLASPPPVPLD